MEIASRFETPRGRGWGSIPSTNFSHIRYQMVDPRGFVLRSSWVRVPDVTQTSADRVVSGGLSRNRGKKDWVDFRVV